MKEFIIIIAGFILSAVMIYRTIGKIYDLIQPEPEEKRAAETPKYRILSDSFDKIGLVNKHFEPGEYLFCIKSRPDLLNECRDKDNGVVIVESFTDNQLHHSAGA